MKTKLLSILSMFLFSMNMTAQSVQFSRFQLNWVPMVGRSMGAQELNVTFKNLTDYPIKYVTVRYYGINQVGDSITDRTHRSDFGVECTGPFVKGKKVKQWVRNATFFTNMVTAKPYFLKIDYMDPNVESEEIDITDENLFVYFPCYKK